MAVTDIDTLLALFHRFGGERYGEHVDQLGHALQVAHLARLDGAPDALIAAALLHDVGQFVDGAGDAAEGRGEDARHEEHGAALLASLFPPAVTMPVRLHVEAKRYLCAVEAHYASCLSPASQLSLRYQGGAMSPAECRAFEADHHGAAAVRLRRYDDSGKRGDWRVPDLESYRPLLERLRIVRHDAA